MSPTGVHLSGFSREQKTGFVFMLVFAIMTIGLGALQLRNTVYGPFVIKPSETPSLSRMAATDEARLKSIDTDHDGLNDFEELNQYTTSPYLPDTDSDTINDKTEIEQGTDPLCPEGDQCATNAATGVTATSSLASSLLGEGFNAMDALTDTVNQINALPGMATSTEPVTTAPQDDSNTINLEAVINDPVQLRALILSTGKIDAKTLESIDNATLQKMARNLFMNASSTTP